MEPEIDVTLTAFKFVTGDTEHICRLCFSTTETEEISLDDSMRLQKAYFDDSISFMEMLQELGVVIEPDLPQVLCSNCAALTINSFLFQKLCQDSNIKWNKVLNKFNATLDQSNTVGPSVQTIYFIVNKNESRMLQSKKKQVSKSKKSAIVKIKQIIKGRQTYVRMKQKSSNVICAECGQRFKSNCHLIKHMNMHSGTRYPCSQCPKIFASQNQLEEHAERVHFPKKIQCPKCPKMFSTEKLLKHHDKMHHTAAICKLCFVQLPSKNDLRAHLDKHDVNKCPRCEKKFLNKQTFRLHSKICGKSDGRPKFFCDICSKGYAGKNGLRTHLKIDHGFGNVISCNWCSKKFDAYSRLRNHIVKHTRERNFHCEQCGNKFVTQAALVYHVRLHTGERPFPCDLCGESFLSASRRMEHKRRKHFGPTKECHVCHVKFVTGHQLRKHVQRHYNPHSKLYVPEAGDIFVSDISIPNMKGQEYVNITNLLSI